MIRTIRIGEQDVKFNASAGTIRRYKEAFHEDMLIKLKGMDEDNLDTDTVFGVAYVMAAEGYQKGVSYEDWLDRFELSDLLNAIADIIDLIFANNASSSIPNSKNAIAAER